MTVCPTISAEQRRAQSEKLRKEEEEARERKEKLRKIEEREVKEHDEEVKKFKDSRIKRFVLLCYIYLEQTLKVLTMTRQTYAGKRAKCGRLDRNKPHFEAVWRYRYLRTAR